jgi:hypothetical protein
LVKPLFWTLLAWRKSCVDQDQEFWFGHTQREKSEEREERENVEERREEREGENLVCVTKPKFLVLVHTSVSRWHDNFERQLLVDVSEGTKMRGKKCVLFLCIVVLVEGLLGMLNKNKPILT